MPFLLLSKLLCDNISNQLRQLCVFACTGVSHGARVAAASMVLEECLSKIPPVRKDPQSVQTFLLELAAELEQ